MATTLEDIAYEEKFAKLHDEIVIQNAAISQCIYLFVEGDSEEVAMPILLNRLNLDIKGLGIVVANYNGIGNLRHAIRLLQNTLSHDRPSIITFDNDLDGKALVGKIGNSIFTEFPIPNYPVVTFKDGYKGGSFEESFNVNLFIDACFQQLLACDELSDKEVQFRTSFHINKPWFSQMVQFIQSVNGKLSLLNKPQIARYMALHCDPVPETYSLLSKLILELRSTHPIKHPDDVELGSA
jgi:hypothetical protein